jgi:transcriptional regulator with GAF, ATPase, and Fis domain
VDFSAIMVRKSLQLSFFPSLLMTLSAWLHSCDQPASDAREAIATLLKCAGVTTCPMPDDLSGSGLLVFTEPDAAVLRCIRACGRKSTVLAIAIGAGTLDSSYMWALLHAGAADVLVCRTAPEIAAQIIAKLARWDTLRQLTESARVKEALVGNSEVWRSVVRQVVEASIFTQAPVLIMGESGTGKELIARLIHDLDTRPDKREMVVVDCTTLSPELSGSELFGHERGAFTGAISVREGAFALANGGTLFLDEIGELPLTLQAQLLRVVQEHQYKRVGSNLWQHTKFRLICATNRDLEAAVKDGTFRGDLYYRIAGWICRTPPLRERKEDILPLASHFLKDCGSSHMTLELDEPVRRYLQAREYPGNVRDLRRVVTRLHHRHAGPGPITIGDIPEDERPLHGISENCWLDEGFESAIRVAIHQSIGLREIGQAASETAIRVALDQEGGNVRRAAFRLGVTDRALQLRRANRRAAK